MKDRKGFRKIVVDGVEYQFAISFPVDKAPLIIAYEGDRKFEVPVTDVPQRPDKPPTWRGKWKKGAACIGRYEVAYLISNYKK